MVSRLYQSASFGGLPRTSSFGGTGLKKSATYGGYSIKSSLTKRHQRRVISSNFLWRLALILLFSSLISQTLLVGKEEFNITYFSVARGTFSDTEKVSTNERVLRFNNTRCQLQVYWVGSEVLITLPGKNFTTLRRKDDSSSCSVNQNRIPPMSVKETKALQKEGRLIFADMTYEIQRNGEFFLFDNMSNLDQNEVARLLSHLNAISKAYSQGHSFVLFLEEDVIPTTEFVHEWETYIHLAPDDWTALQWSTSNTLVRKHFSNLVDPWVNWQPDHWSSKAYMLSRDGMRAIIEKTHSTDSSGRDIWTIQERTMVSPEELIFFLAQRSYTITRSLLSLASESPEGSVSLFPSSDSFPSFPELLRKESILVLMSVRIKSADQILEEIDRIDQSLLPHVRAMISSLPPNVQIHFRVLASQFHKFAFLKTYESVMENYDYVLVKDNDQRIVGFPWHTFMEKKGDAIIAGPLRQTMKESLMRHAGKPKRQAFQLHEAREWKDGRLQSAESYSSITPVSVPFLEMYMALFDGKFLKWWSSRVLIPDVIDQPNNSGLDMIWCGAAKEFNPFQTSCVLVPVVSLHEDTRQIMRSDIFYVRAGHQMIDFIRNNFGSWMSYSEKWTSFIKRVSLSSIEEQCLKILESNEFDIEKCANIVSSEAYQQGWLQRYRRFLADWNFPSYLFFFNNETPLA